MEVQKEGRGRIMIVLRSQAEGVCVCVCEKEREREWKRLPSSLGLKREKNKSCEFAKKKFRKTKWYELRSRQVLVFQH